jgi:hypothetical protein
MISEDILEVTIERSRFLAVLHGEVAELRRDRGTHWDRKLGVGRHYKYVRIYDGMGGDAPALDCICLGIDIQDDEYVVQLGEIIESHNLFLIPIDQLRPEDYPDNVHIQFAVKTIIKYKVRP